MHFHVLSKRRRMRIGLVAAVYATIVRLVRRVHMHVLLSVRAVREPSLAAVKLALERFLTFLFMNS